MCEMERKLDVQSFFMMDENFLLHKRRAMELLELHEGDARRGRCTFSPRRTPSASTPCGNWWNWAFPGSGWAGVAALRLREAARHRPLELARELRPHGISCWAPPSSAWSTTLPRTSGGDRARRIARDRFPPVHALHAGPGTPLYAEMPSRAACWKASTWPIFMARTVQFPARRHFSRRFQAMARLGFPPGLRAQRPQPLPHLPHDPGRLAAL